MKSRIAVCALCFVLFLTGSPLRAQTQEVLTDQPIRFGLQRIGCTFDFGVADINVDKLNSRLQAMGIDQFYDQLAVLSFGIYAGFEGGFGLSVDFSAGSALGGKEENNTGARINLNTFSYGPTIYYDLLTTRRSRLMALGGLRMNHIRFKYNADVFAFPDFDNLLGAPAAGSNYAIVMKTAIPAESATLGARFQYRLGRKENIKQREYYLGIDTGYNYSFQTVPWSEPLSKQTIKNMPAIKTDHFYMCFTFSAYLLR